MPTGGLRGALRWSALFAFLRLCIATLPFAGLFPAAAQAVVCRADGIAEIARVQYVHDGDTLILDDRRKVRLIGIDTPELGRDGRPDQPWAVAARDALRRLLANHGSRVQLRFDQERHDRYGRLLAHLYLMDGRSVEAWLLEQGLALQLVVPPNTGNLACYRRAEQAARQARRGLWSHPRYQVRDSHALPRTAAGLRIVRGRVGRIGQGRYNVWLDLPGGVALRIPRSDLEFFDGLDLQSLRGREVEARGWLQRRKGEWRMTIRHPAALGIVSDDARYADKEGKP